MIEFEKGSHIHFVGIAGSGMSGIAQILLERGFHVSGSDAKDGAVMESLRVRGAKTYIGHRAEQIGDANYLVISSAINDENPELVEARSRGVTVLRRSSALAKLLPGRRSIAVAGTHGKTTTSAMLAHSLHEMKRNPSFVIGSKILSLGESARQGSGTDFVVEADESDGSFLDYQPNGAIITNVELDHVDNFSTVDQIIELFSKFILTVKEFVVLCADDPIASTLPVPHGVTRVTYGTRDASDLKLEDIRDDANGVVAELLWHGRPIGTLNMSVRGRHNALNAGAVLATAMHCGLDPKEMLAALRVFQGTARRFELKGEVGGVTVIDDYGHHPTEILATILAARSLLARQGKGRLALLFQPHRFSRTAAFLNEFADALSEGDHSLILDIYSAGEVPIKEISSANIAQRARNCRYVSDPRQAIDDLVEWAEPGDLILTLGAGDVTQLGPEILASLAQGSKEN